MEFEVCFGYVWAWFAAGYLRWDFLDSLGIRSVYVWVEFEIYLFFLIYFFGFVQNECGLGLALYFNNIACKWSSEWIRKDIHLSRNCINHQNDQPVAFLYQPICLFVSAASFIVALMQLHQEQQINLSQKVHVTPFVIIYHDAMAIKRQNTHWNAERVEVAHLFPAVPAVLCLPASRALPSDYTITHLTALKSHISRNANLWKF